MAAHSSAQPASKGSYAGSGKVTGAGAVKSATLRWTTGTDNVVPGLVVDVEGVKPGPKTGGTARGADREDEALLVRVAARDQAAFRQLVDRHLNAMLALARRFLRDEAEAEDVAQEAFLRLWRLGAGLDIGPAGVAPWLRRVVSNLAIDRMRVRGRIDVTDEVPEVPEAPGQLRGLEQAELASRVAAALGALPDRQRTALTLFHYEGLTMDEVGRMMDVSQEAVESLLARARRSLRASLAGEWRALLPDAGEEP